MQKYMNNKIILKNVSTENCRNGQSDYTCTTYVVYSTVQTTLASDQLSLSLFVANCPVKSVLLPDRADRTTL